MKPFVVVMEPVAQPRPRVMMGKNQSFPHAFVPKAHAIHAYRKAVAIEASNARPEVGVIPFPEGPVVVDISFVFEKPKSLAGNPLWKVSKPDIENLVKGVLDAMSGIVYTDDNQVASLHTQKFYGKRAETRIEVRPIP